MISVRRRAEPPASLRGGQSFDGHDVKQALREDFLDKCYLCERRLSGHLQVDHLLPKVGLYAERRLDWSNLYPSDDCNQCRKAWPKERRVRADTRYPCEGLLDPTDPDYDIESRLEQSIADVPPVGPDELGVTFTASDSSDTVARNTAAELRHLYHSDTDNARSLRRETYARWHRVLTHICRFLATENSDDAERVRCLLRREQPFSAVLRGTARAMVPTGHHEALGIAATLDFGRQ